MDSRLIKVWAWAGPIGLIIFGTGIGPLAAQFIPPPRPDLSAVEVASHYATHPNGVKLGAILMLIGACCLNGFYGGLSALLRRIGSTSCAYVQLLSGALANLGFIVGGVLWCAAAYRPDRAPEDILLLHDMAWIILVWPGPLGIIQLLPVALAILNDARPQPLVPRWVGYLNIWVFILFFPAVLVPFFFSGPFAWNGLLSFWVAALAFTLWIGVMCWAMLKSAKRTDD